jgi:amino acid transporter
VWAAQRDRAYALNVVGTFSSKTLQKVMEIVLIAALVLLRSRARSRRQPEAGGAAAGGGASFGLAMVFVLFTYGGWNEAAYLAGEVRDARRNMVKILVAGILAVTALYFSSTARIWRRSVWAACAARRRWRRT